MNKNDKCRFSYLYLLHNDLTNMKIITIIANNKNNSNNIKNYDNSIYNGNYNKIK